MRHDTELSAVSLPMQAVSDEQLKHPGSLSNVTAYTTDPQPEGISRKLAYRRQVLQSGLATPAGISSGGDIANSGTQCSGTGNTCQNTPTTVNNNKQVYVFNYLPPSKHPLRHA